MAPKKAGAKGVAVVKTAPKKVIRKDGWYANTVPELKAELKQRGAPVGGTKDDLVTRLDELDRDGKTGEGSAVPAKKGASKKSGTGGKATTGKKTPAKATTGNKDGKKPAPRNGFKARSTPSPSPGIDGAIGKTATGRVMKVNATHKKRAFSYQKKLDAIMKQIEDDDEVAGANARAGKIGVFGPAYQSLKNAAFQLEVIRIHDDPTSDVDEDVPEEE